MHARPNLAPHRGYTLVEMMVVAAMMSILALAVVPVAELSSMRWKERELKAALREIRAAIDAYKQASERAEPRLLAGSGYPRSLGDLLEPDPGAATPRRFLRRIPRDPFAPEGLPAEQSWGLRSFDSPAHAPRAGLDVYDVHSLSERVGSNGIPLRQW